MRRETEGNPFFTTEMLRHLAETGLVHQNETGRWVASEDLYEKGLPQSVREVVGQRVDRRGRTCEGSCPKRRSSVGTSTLRCWPRWPEPTRTRCWTSSKKASRRAFSSRSKEFQSRVSFAHALTQHTLYDDLGASRRAWAHRKVANILEQRYGSAPESAAAELAHHFLAATKSADAAKALTYCKLAGDQALANAAPADALSWFAQALELYRQLPSNESIHCDILIGLGTAQIRIGKTSPTAKPSSTLPPSRKPRAVSTASWRPHWPTTVLASARRPGGP